MLNAAARRCFTSTGRARDKGVVAKLTQLLSQGSANSKPLDKGTALILGAPALGCFCMYIWKQDRDHLAPLRARQQQKQQQLQQQQDAE